MATAKVAITLETELLKRLDRLVKSRQFPNRSRAIQSAVNEKLARLESGRLARECAKLEPARERRLAETGMAAEVDQWPEY